MSDRYDAIDDATAEALLRGEAVEAELQPLADAVTTLRNAPHPPGTPSDELARRMASGDFGTEAPAVRIRRQRARSRLAALSLRAKIATLFVIGLTALTGMAAAGALPAPVQQRMKDIVESVTPIEVPEPANDDDGVDTDDGSAPEDGTDPGADSEEELERDERSGGSEGDDSGDGHWDGKEPAPSTEPTPGQSGGRPNPTKPPKHEDSRTKAPKSSPTPSPTPTPTPTPTTASTPDPMPEATSTPIIDLNL